MNNLEKNIIDSKQKETHYRLIEFKKKVKHENLLILMKEKILQNQ